MIAPYVSAGRGGVLTKTPLHWPPDAGPLAGCSVMALAGTADDTSYQLDDPPNSAFGDEADDRAPRRSRRYTTVSLANHINPASTLAHAVRKEIVSV